MWSYRTWFTWLQRWRDNFGRDMLGQHLNQALHHLGSRIYRERVLSGQDPLFLLELNYQRLKLMFLLIPKVNLKLNLNVPMMLNVSGVKDMDIMLQSVQTRES